ncbi:MAG: DsrE family protein [Methylotenera sp.]|nr:DsrE family protein [Methylotenera sp.]
MRKSLKDFYNVEVMLGNAIHHGGEIGICGTCMDARDMAEIDLITGTRRSSLAELTDWTIWAGKVLVF